MCRAMVWTEKRVLLLEEPQLPTAAVEWNVEFSGSLEIEKGSAVEQHQLFCVFGDGAAVVSAHNQQQTDAQVCNSSSIQ